MNVKQRTSIMNSFSKLLKIKKLSQIELVTLFNLQGKLDTLLKSHVLPLAD